MRDEVLMDLIDRAMNDEGFKQRARADLEGALEENGYRLDGEEYAAVKEFHERTAGMSDAEVDRALARNAAGGGRQFG